MQLQMKNAMLGLLVGAGLAAVVAGLCEPRSPVYAQHPELSARGLINGQLLALPAEGPEGQRQITLIEPQQRVMAVYHVNTTSGEITLRSVRSLRWDLLMDEFNGVSPTPQEIRSLLEPR